MTPTDKSKLVRLNTICWLTAVVVPVILHVGLSHTRFPWPLILPLLLLGPMLASNSLLTKAAGTTATEEPASPR